MRHSPVVLLERFLEKVTPDFDEVTVFLISFTFTVLFISNPDMRVHTIRGLVHPFSFLMFLFLLMAKILAWYHAFSSSKKSQFEKNVLLVFGLIMPIGIGFEAFSYILTSYSGIALLFLALPILNIIYAALLLFLYRTTSIIHSFDPRNAERKEVFFGMGMIILIVIVIESVLGMQWPVAYSMGIVYATFLGRIPYMIWMNIHKRRSKSQTSINALK
jgi:hypothetical protein